MTSPLKAGKDRDYDRARRLLLLLFLLIAFVILFFSLILLRILPAPRAEI